MTTYQRAKAEAERRANLMGAQADRGGFDLVVSQAVAFDMAQTAKADGDRDKRAFALGALRGFRG